MESLASLPSRCCFEVVEGVQALQLPSMAYLCWQGTPAADAIKVTNGKEQLHEVYKQAQKRHTAALAKRHLKQPLSDRPIKRQQLLPIALQSAAGDEELEAAISAVAGKDAAKATAAVLVQKAKQAGAAVVPMQQQAGAPVVAAVPSSHPAAAPPAGNAQPGSSGKSSKQVYTIEQLKARTNKELVDLLRARSCPVSGQKTELIKRMLDYQRRLKKAQGTA